MILNNQINATRCGNLLNSEMDTFFFRKNSVKMPSTRVQPAWVNSPSETQRSAFSTLKKLPKDLDFFQWTVGLVDGDGDFSFSFEKKSWCFCFKISQSIRNQRLLYFVKSNLKIGTMTVVKKNQMVYYRVRSKKLIIKHILPIFAKHPLLTYKHLLFDLFKEALLLDSLKSADGSNQILKLQEKYKQIKELSRNCKSGKLPAWIQSPVWESVARPLTKQNVSKLVTKAWLVGFVEASGSFYICKKGKTQMAHAFEITQKHDKIVLEAISMVLPFQLGKKNGHYRIIGERVSSIPIFSEYFFKTMKGVKALQYRVWSRSFGKRQRGFAYLLSMQEKIRKIKFIKFKNFKKLTY